MRKVLTLPDFKTHYKAIVVKTVYLLNIKQIDKQNKTENPLKSTHVNTTNWSLTKKQRQFNGKHIIFSTNGTEKTGHPHGKKENLDTNLLFKKN